MVPRSAPRCAADRTRHPGRHRRPAEGRAGRQFLPRHPQRGRKRGGGDLQPARQRPHRHRLAGHRRDPGGADQGGRRPHQGARQRRPRRIPRL